MYSNWENTMRNKSKDDETSSPKHKRRLTARKPNPPEYPSVLQLWVQNTDAPQPSHMQPSLLHLPFVPSAINTQPPFSSAWISTTLINKEVHKYMLIRSGFIQEQQFGKRQCLMENPAIDFPIGCCHHFCCLQINNLKNICFPMTAGVNNSMHLLSYFLQNKLVLYYLMCFKIITGIPDGINVHKMYTYLKPLAKHRTSTASQHSNSYQFFSRCGIKKNCYS